MEEVAQEWMVARNLALKGRRRPSAELTQRLGTPPVADFPWGGDAAAARRALVALALADVRQCR